MLKILAAITALLAISIYVLFFSTFFKIKTINLQDENKCITSSDIGGEFNLVGKNILTIDSTQVSTSLTEKYSCADTVSVTKKYPTTLVVVVSTKEPIGAIDGTQFLIREDGYVSSAQQSHTLPKIFLPEQLDVQDGEKITEPQVLFALKITKLLSKTDFAPTSVRVVAPPDVAVYDQLGRIALFSQQSSPDDQVDSLQSVLAKAKIDPTKIAKIDLRFAKPVIEEKK